METRASFVIVGAFVLSFFVAIVAAVVWLADLEIDADTVQYDVFFEGSVSGLSVGNAVRYNGIPIGIVTDMRISAERFGEVRVVIEVPRDTPIREDAVARLEYQGITGVAFIQIDGGTEAAAPLRARAGEQRAEIASERSALQQVFETAPEIMENLETLVGQATKMLSDENIAQVGGTLENINNFSGALAESSEDVAFLLQEGAATMEQFRQTAEDAERLVSAFADRAETLAVSTEGTIEEARLLVTDVRVFTERLDGLAQEALPLIGTAHTAIASYGALGQDLRREAANLSARMSRTLENLDTAVAGTDEKMDALLAEATTTLDSIEALTSAAAARVDTVADAAEVTLGTYSDAAINVRDNANNRIASVADTAEATIGAYAGLADDISPKVNAVAEDAQAAMADFRGISSDMRKAADSIAGAADEARLLIAENREPVTAFSSTGLYEFTQLLAEMRVLVSSLTRITTQIERDPAQFFFGDSQQGFEVQ
jgi:phospholipid/cholesterol/gamma-HCH transport system substrate-binding protein